MKLVNYIKHNMVSIKRRFSSRFQKEEADHFLRRMGETVETRGARSHVCNIAPIMLLEDEGHYELKTVFKERFPQGRHQSLLNSLYRSLGKEEKDEDLNIIKPQGIMPDPASYIDGNKAYAGSYLKKRRVSLRGRNKALMCLAVIKILKTLPEVVPRQNPKGQLSSVAKDLASQLNKTKHSEILEVLEAFLKGSSCPLANELRANVGPELFEAIETEIGSYTDEEMTRLGVVVPKSVPKYWEKPPQSLKNRLRKAPRLALAVTGLFLVALVSIGMGILSDRTIFEIGQTEGPGAAQEILDDHPELVAKNKQLQLAAAYTAYDDGRMEDAKALVNEIFCDPQNKPLERAHCHYLLGSINHFQGNYQRALQNHSMAVGYYETDPSEKINLFNSLTEKARCLIVFRDFAKADNALSDAFLAWSESRVPEKENFLVQWHAVSFKMELARGNLSSALQQAEAQLNLTNTNRKPRLFSALANVGFVHALLGNFELAKSFTLEAKDILTQLDNEKRNYFLLVNEYAIAVKVGSPEAHLIRAKIDSYMNSNQLNELRLQLETVDGDGPAWKENAGVSVLLPEAHSAYEQGQVDDAIKIIQAIFRNPLTTELERASGHYLLGSAFHYKGFYQKAVYNFGMAIGYFETDSSEKINLFNSLTEKARSLIVLRKFEKAHGALEKAFDVWSESRATKKSDYISQWYAVRYRLALVRWDLTDALALAKKQEQTINPQDKSRRMSALANIGFVHALVGELDAAKEYTEKARFISDDLGNEKKSRFIQVNDYVIAALEKSANAVGIRAEIEGYIDRNQAEELRLQLEVFDKQSAIW